MNSQVFLEFEYIPERNRYEGKNTKYPYHIFNSVYGNFYVPVVELISCIKSKRRIFFTEKTDRIVEHISSYKYVDGYVGNQNIDFYGKNIIVNSLGLCKGNSCVKLYRH